MYGTVECLLSLACSAALIATATGLGRSTRMRPRSASMSRLVSNAMCVIAALTGSGKYRPNDRSVSTVTWNRGVDIAARDNARSSVVSMVSALQDGIAQNGRTIPTGIIARRHCMINWFHMASSRSHDHLAMTTRALIRSLPRESWKHTIVRVEWNLGARHLMRCIPQTDRSATIR